MDLKQKWFKYGFISAFLTLFIFDGVSLQHICSPGLTTPGYTYPKGDIVLQYGDPLDIICVLHDPKELKNASFSLMYNKNNETVPAEFIEILNSTSIKLHIDEPAKASHDSYTCVLNKNNVTIPVCMNVVTVGTKPQPVQDFECIGYNYDNLTCSWTPPENYVKTEYKLTFELEGRASRLLVNDCPEIRYPQPNNADKKISCFWSMKTRPQYRLAHDIFKFNLTMTNPFGTNHLNKTFNHFRHVLSGPPENLTVINTTSSSIYLHWIVPHSMQAFPPGVHHRVFYQCEYGEKEWHFGGIITAKKEVYFNLTGLKYAHAIYDIRVSIRSADALPDDESMWSKNASITHRTSSKIPDGPPKTNIGSFEINHRLPNIDIYIYWKQILEEEKNGPDFRYLIQVEGNDSIVPENVTNTYAKFVNLPNHKSYTFYIWSVNAIGRSTERATIRVPSGVEQIKQPSGFTKVEYGDGTYELHWDPQTNENLTNYTIFWCSDKREYPHRCNGKLNWTVVPANNKTHNVTVSKNQIYQFAISANSANSSSGMLWAACTVLHNENIGKMKNVYIRSVGSTEIYVGWKLDCADRIGSVEGFIVYYCPIISPDRTECKGPERNATFPGDSRIDGGVIKHLIPYTTYMLTVAVKTKHTYSQQSDPLYNTTLEDAPDTPPLNFSVTEVTNSSITLTWLPPRAKNGFLRKYIIKYNDKKISVEPNQLSHTLKSLESYKNYLISIQACTEQCSEFSKQLNVTTKMGYPGPIRQPSISYQNDTFIRISWDPPIQRNGWNDLSVVRITEIHQGKNNTYTFNTSSRTYSLDDCGDGGKYNTFTVSVKAVNKFGDKQLEGPWSDELVSNCRAPVNIMMFVVICLIVGFIIGMVFLATRIYKHCKQMKDVQFTLPPGLAENINEHNLVPWNATKVPEEPDRQSADEELLLVKMSEERSRNHPCADSGHESVTGSLESGTNLSQSSDSGTEQRTYSPITPKKQYYQSGVIEGEEPSDRTQQQQPSPYVMTGDPIMKTTISDYIKINDKPYISCDFNQAAPYVLTGEAVKPTLVDHPTAYISAPYVLTGDVSTLKTVNPGYIPFNHEVTGYK